MDSFADGEYENINKDEDRTACKENTEKTQHV